MRYLLTISTVLLFLSSPAPAQPEATFEGLGFSGGRSDCNFGFDGSKAYGVSANGAVVVGEVVDDSEVVRAFRWEEGEMITLGHLPGNNYGWTLAYATSSDGSVVVGTDYFDYNIEGEAFRWEDDAIEGLGLLPDHSLSIAYATSIDGSVVIGYSSNSYSDGNYEAFRWEDGNMEGLGSLPGGSATSNARGISADGSVIVGSAGAEMGREAFRWEGGQMIGLGHLPGGDSYSYATDVSADGSVVVGSSRSADADENRTEAFRWENGEMVGLGDLLGGDFSSSASAVSADGSVVIGGSRSANGIEPFVWTEEGGMRNLRQVFEDDYELDLTGWTLGRATDISGGGTVIVGHGLNTDDCVEAWRAAGLFPVATDPDVPNREALALANHPNPANASTTLTFSLNEPQEVTLEVYDTLGRLMSRDQRQVQVGLNNIELRTTTWPAGAYIARLRAGGRENRHRFTVVH